MNKRHTQSSKLWLKRNSHDIYHTQAKSNGYRSRAVYKLSEIDKKFGILTNGINVLDLGAAPGSWSQYISRTVTNAKIIAVDLITIDTIPNVSTINCDIHHYDIVQRIYQLFSNKTDLIVSDIAPNSTGCKITDNIRAIELCLRVLDIAQILLKTECNLVIKIFHGCDEHILIDKIQKIFRKFKYFKPLCSYKDSSELYIICLNKI